jgi:hypothetical protein
MAIIGTNNKLLKAPTITKETTVQKALKTTPKVEQGKLLKKTESKPTNMSNDELYRYANKENQFSDKYR